MNTDKIREAKKKWLEKAENSGLKRTGIKFTTLSDIEVNLLYTPDDLEGFDYMEKAWFSRGISIYPWNSLQYVSRATLDDEAICGVWDPRGHESTL
jgi:hypothetical protein